MRAEEQLWRVRGINTVPAMVVEGKYLISGGQPAGVFEEALRGMAGRGKGKEAAGCPRFVLRL